MKQVDPKDFGQAMSRERRQLLEEQRQRRQTITLFVAVAVALAILAVAAFALDHRPIAALLGLGSYSSAVLAGAITLDR